MNRLRLPLCIIAVLALCVGFFVREKTLYEKESEYNTILVTEDDRGIRTLYFQRYGSRQSVVNVSDPDYLELEYVRVMPVGLALVEQPERILMVGLGGGTIPRFLHKHYPQTTIDVVDIDPDVVDVAKKYFGFREDTTLHVHVEDGRKFIEEAKAGYDIIFLDAYGADEIPYHLATREFLQAVRRALTPKGIVVANIWSSRSNRLYHSMVRTYQDVFDSLYILDVEGAGNQIFVAYPRQDRLTRNALARKARQISKEKQFPFDMGDVVLYGFRSVGKQDVRGRVLLDKEKVLEAPSFE